MQIVQIVPKLPPSISGVGDYAVLLARQLQLGYGIDSRFVLVSDGQAPEMANDFAVSVIQPRARLLPEALRGQPVCLHYVGYGYQKRGYAAWLARGLQTWKRENPSRHLITMFHEIFATGRIWNSSVWLSRLQRRVACAIANTSDALLTNRQAYADTLAQF